MKEEARNREEAGRKLEGRTFWLARDIKNGRAVEYEAKASDDETKNELVKRMIKSLSNWFLFMDKLSSIDSYIEKTGKGYQLKVWGNWTYNRSEVFQIAYKGNNTDKRIEFEEENGEWVAYFTERNYYGIPDRKRRIYLSAKEQILAQK